MANISARYVPNVFGRLSFPLKHNGDSIFNKVFDANNSNIVDIDNDTISIPNHFFKTGERLTYTLPNNGSQIEIDPSSPGAGGTTLLPNTVYPIYIDENTIRVSLASSLAIQNQYVDITAVGVGASHSLTAEKQNSKCLISIDNIIQSPVAISDGVGISTIDFNNASKITLNSLNNIKNGTILKIGEEYSRVSAINYENNEVTLYRGSPQDPYLGSVVNDFVGFSTAYIIKGNYNIVKDIIYFTDAPLEGNTFNIKVPPSDLNFSTTGPISYSFNYFTNSYETGSQVTLYAAIPPNNLESGKSYFIIKNFENNFSFATSYANAINGTKVGFTSTGVEVSSLQLNQILTNNTSSFAGRAFLRSNYDGNLVFDDISLSFNGISTEFTLKSSGINTVGIKSDNGIVLINNIFQYPEFEESFIFSEDAVSGITSITFIGSVGEFDSGVGTIKSYDINVGGRPRGGIIVGYAISGGFNYQPLIQSESFISALSPEGSVVNSNIQISVSGSGYRAGITTYYAYFYDDNGNRLSGLGTAIIENGSVVSIDVVETDTYTEIPNIVIDSPIPYDNVPLSGSNLGIGASASFDVSSSGNITNFKFSNPGYGYTIGEILSPVGILTGIGYTTSDELKIRIDDTYSDSFSAWNIGILQKLNDLSSFTNGRRKVFTLSETIDGVSQPISLETELGSPINLEDNLLIFLNDVLQIPGSSYEFNRGTKITFKEAPPSGSNLKVYFYKGSFGDSEQVDIEPPIELGDNLVINKDLLNKNPTKQLRRTVKEILTSDTLKTELYGKGGLSESSSQIRSISWTPKKRDLIISGEYINKTRYNQRSGIGSFSKVGITSGTFVGLNTNIVGINTSVGIGSLIVLGDYVESDYTGVGVTIVSIGSSVIGIGRTYYNSSSPVGINTIPISIWRKL
jgi:hypothetical protein